MKAIKALAPWFGAKRTLARDIIPHLGKHKVYVEPFCGSMAVLFAKEQAKLEIVNDQNLNITNVGWCLQHEKPRRELLRILKSTIPTESHHEACREHYHTKPVVAERLDPNPHAAAVAISYWWLGMNGLAGTTTKLPFAARFTASGGDPLVRWASLLRSLSWMAERLRGVTILNRCASDIIKSTRDLNGTTLYVDPPYLHKSAEYEHDFSGVFEHESDTIFGKDDRLTHEQLARELNIYICARVVLSYYDDPKLDKFYPKNKWRKVQLTAAKTMRHGSKNRHEQQEVQAPEVLLINQPEEHHA